MSYANLEKRKQYDKGYKRLHYDSKKQQKYRQKSMKKYNDILTELKVNGCGICGSYKHLEFAHSEHDTKKFAISNFFRHTNDEIVEEIMKCILLCRSCHSVIDNKVLNLGKYYKGVKE